MLTWGCSDDMRVGESKRIGHLASEDGENNADREAGLGG